MTPQGRSGLRRGATTLSISVLSMVAIGGLHTTMADDRFVVSGVVGLIAALIASELSDRYQWYLGEHLSFAAGSFLVLGPIAMAEVPGPDAYLDLARSLVTSWSTLLSSSAPTDLTAELRVVPYTVVWLSALWPEMPAGGDMADFLAHRGGDAAAVRKELDQALKDCTKMMKRVRDTKPGIKGLQVALDALNESNPRYLKIFDVALPAVTGVALAGASGGLGFAGAATGLDHANTAVTLAAVMGNEAKGFLESL